MSWESDVKELQRQTAMAHEMGGEDSVAFHHGRGKLTVRERIALLADSGSFQEIGALAGTATWEGAELESLKPSNSVIGTCKVDGRKVALSGGDFTIRGGASDAAIGNKTHFAETVAHDTRIPYIRLLDATGGSVKTFEKIGRTYLPGNAGGGSLPTRMLQSIPVVSAVMGSVAGLPAVQACLCHFNIMVKNTSQVFVAGPKVVEQATGRPITKEDLGDERIQVKNGVIMNLAEDEPDAIRQIRQFLSYLPANVWEAPPRIECDDDPERRDESLLSIIPRNRRKIYDPRKVLGAVLDRDSFFEIGPYYGRARITGLARVNGVPCGVMSNNPKFNGGSMDVAAGEKTIRLIELCDTFHLPLVYFADEPGFSVGPAQEELGIVRAGARIVTTLSVSETPYVCFIMRQLYGVAGGLHQRSNGLYRRYAWPSTHGGSMHIEGGTAIAYKREIESAEDPDAKRQEIEDRLQAISSPFRNAHAFGVEDIIDPRDTRPLLVDFIEDAWKVVQTQLGPRAGMSYRP
ncbi:MAG: methylmalonyl-CoA carboxyltransferase [Gammaproteobacteria bacterium]|nr:methylmalonyl-CoA carboxyltransferase [Gammaproteobacteria bacterium]